MNDEREIAHLARLWLEKANHDLRAAEYVLTLEEDCPLDIVCYHAHQCAEKLLKTLLVHRQIDFPKTHDLEEILALVQPAFPLELDVSAVISLNQYATDSRYPEVWRSFTHSEAERAVALARKVREEVRKHLPKMAP